MMKKSLAMAAGIVAITGTAFATQPIPDDNFDALTIADLAGQNSWDQSGAASSPNVGVVAGSLTYTGYSTVATGNKVFLSDAGQDVGKSFAATLPVADGNTYYYSFLLQHDGTDTGSTTGDYCNFLLFILLLHSSYVSFASRNCQYPSDAILILSSFLPQANVTEQWY